jgi:ABC-type multidrug transport system fused ATPase/permease subunit
MNDTYIKSDNSFKVIARLMRLFRKGYIWLFITIIASLLGGLSSILMAKGIQGISDAALAHKMDTLVSFLYYIFAAIAIGVATSIVASYTSGRFSNYSRVILLNKSEEHIAALQMSHIDDHRTGDLLSRMTNDVREVQRFIEYVLISMITSLIVIVTSLAYMFVINWQLTLISSILFPAFTILVAQLSKKIESQMKKQQESLGSESNVLEDSFMGLSELKAFGRGKFMYNKYAKEVDISTIRSNQMYATEMKIQPIGIICSSLPFITTMFFGGFLILNHSITLGGLLAYISLSNNVTDPFNSMPGLITSFRSSVACIRRVFEIWNYPQEEKGGNEFSIDNQSDAPVITFEDVNFRYNEETDLFKGLDFEIAKGEKVAIVGSSGCGKSTILKLITGFYQTISGKIRIYGHDISDWNLEALRSLMSEVLQDSYLFPDTILRNISYGKENADVTEIEQAAKSAYISDFIESLPDKYDTLVGERGVRLSGGQRQRVAIARALLKDAPVLLLDEATSALDTESEKEVQSALEKLMIGRTTLVIAHRISTIRNADRILVMDKGRIVETGTHDELISKQSVYRQLYNKQFRNSENLCLSEAVEG